MSSKKVNPVEEVDTPQGAKAVADKGQKEASKDSIPTKVIFVDKGEDCELLIAASGALWEDVLDIVRRDPKQASMVRFSHSALHLACSHNAPLEVIEALTKAAPHTASYNPHRGRYNLPLDYLFRHPKRDTTEKVRAILRADPKVGFESLSELQSAGWLLNGVNQALETYPEGTPFPTQRPFASNKMEELTTVRWDIFCDILKSHHYVTAENLNSLPLLPALFSLSELPFPKRFIDLALRLHAADQGASMEGGRYVLLKCLSNPFRALDGNQIMTVFDHHPFLLSQRDHETGLYPFMLAASALSSPAMRALLEKKERHKRKAKAQALVDKRMVEWKPRALHAWQYELQDLGTENQEDEDDNEMDQDFLYEWVVERSEDLHGDLWYDENYDGCETAELAPKVTVDLTYRLLRRYPELLHNFDANLDGNQSSNKKSSKPVKRKRNGAGDDGPTMCKRWNWTFGRRVSRAKDRGRQHTTRRLSKRDSVGRREVTHTFTPVDFHQCTFTA